MALMACSCQLAEQTGLLGIRRARDELRQGVLFPLQTYLHLPSKRGGKKLYKDPLASSWGSESTRHHFGFTKGKGIFCFQALSLRRDRDSVNKRWIIALVHHPWSRTGKK